jgi:uncharacterized membrane protein YkvA (DUF1232 family)
MIQWIQWNKYLEKEMMKLKEIKDNAKKYIELCKLLYTDSRTPKITKILLWIIIGYALSPIDFIPDFIPVIGHLDDIVILPVLLYIAIKSVPKNVYIENYVKILKK